MHDSTASLLRVSRVSFHLRFWSRWSRFRVQLRSFWSFAFARLALLLPKLGLASWQPPSETTASLRDPTWSWNMGNGNMVFAVGKCCKHFSSRDLIELQVVKHWPLHTQVRTFCSKSCNPSKYAPSFGFGFMIFSWEKRYRNLHHHPTEVFLSGLCRKPAYCTILQPLEDMSSAMTSMISPCPAQRDSTAANPVHPLSKSQPHPGRACLWWVLANIVFRMSSGLQKHRERNMLGESGPRECIWSASIAPGLWSDE